MGSRFAAWVRRGCVATGRGLVLSGGSLLAALLAVTLVLAVVSIAWVVLVPSAVVVVRRLANRARRLAEAWSGVHIPVPYLPRPPLDGGTSRLRRQWTWISSDPATWRDLLWLLVDPIIGLFLAALPAAVIAYGLFGLAQPVVGQSIVDAGGTDWYGLIHIDSQHAAWSAAALGAGVVLLGLAIAPGALLLHARLTRSLLAPDPAALVRRVRHLTETRADAVDAQAAELRRIERDLHDGAQARLVALSLTLSAAEQRVADDPQAVRALLGEAREASTKALDELRDLVRGIHPPVLADRGLGDAVRALALDSQLTVQVSVDVSGRLPPAAESAVYFAVSELLANAAKHSGAEHVWLDLRHHDGALRVRVTDDGCGGADIGNGTGLRGVQRRLATFDGTLTLTSPPGGPTTVTMEVPCALSSPKTTLSSETA